MGIIIESSETQFVLDDGTGQIQVRNASGHRCMAGDVVMIIGSVTEGDGMCLIGNIIKRIDPTWVKVRKHELQKRQIVPEKKIEPSVTVPKERIDGLNYILDLVKKLDEGRGVPMEEIVQKSMIKEGREIIESLMSRGDVFEVEPGKIKVLE
jgi:hypothetical protein